LKSDICVVTTDLIGQAPEIDSVRPIRSQVTTQVLDKKMATHKKNTTKQLKTDRISIKMHFVFKGNNCDKKRINPQPWGTEMVF
jgi:hypothetical protein